MMFQLNAMFFNDAIQGKSIEYLCIASKRSDNKNIDITENI